MESIFHEKQEGSLCAQHCLNALLQGPYFTPVDLATLAQTLDDEERLRMAESGVDSEDYRRFLEQPSGNYDDSGYFSVQVISSALEVWGLELVPYNSTEPRALEAQKCPANMKAFICNYRDHWFTIRRLGRQWFNLNSLLSQPQLISDTYLAMFLAQLQQEGYSIFVAFGIFPECEADNLLMLVPAVQMEKPQMVQKIKPFASTGIRLGGASSSVAAEDEDGELQRALRLSLGQTSDDDAFSSVRMDTRTNAGETRRMISQNSQDDDEDLQKALCLSLQKEAVDVDNDALELERALQMSLECCDSTPPTTDVTTEEIRRRRLNYLDARSRRPTELTPKPSTESKVNT